MKLNIVILTKTDHETYIVRFDLYSPYEEHPKVWSFAFPKWEILQVLWSFAHMPRAFINVAIKGEELLDENYKAPERTTSESKSGTISTEKDPIFGDGSEDSIEQINRARINDSRYDSIQLQVSAERATMASSGVSEAGASV